MLAGLTGVGWHQRQGRRTGGDGRRRIPRQPRRIIPYGKRPDGSELPDWKQDYNSGHRKIRARVEHALARLNTFKILRDYRRAGSTLAVTAAGIAHLLSHFAVWTPAKRRTGRSAGAPFSTSRRLHDRRL
jgi:hypothetical protein